jgi:hypothetical protein
MKNKDIILLIVCSCLGCTLGFPFGLYLGSKIFKKPMVRFDKNEDVTSQKNTK